MQEITCISESVYGSALTRGKRYNVLAFDTDKRQYKIQGNQGRIRWFPANCFDRDVKPVPILTTFQLDDPIDENHLIDVTVQLSNGTRRWCMFATPSALANCGDHVEGTAVKFHYGNRHIIVANELSEELIGRMLKYIDSQGQLMECTLPFE